MKVKLKQKKIAFVQLLVWLTPTVEAAPRPSEQLTTPTASYQALSGAGAAAPGDVSQMDANPAILPALTKQYTLFGGTSWETHPDLLEAGVFDSMTSPVAAALRIRQTIPETPLSRDRRATLAMAYQLPRSGWSIGAMGDYEQLKVDGLTNEEETNAFGGVGVFYNMKKPNLPPLFAGVGVTHLGDSFDPTRYDVGLGTSLNAYDLSIDALADDDGGFKAYTGGLGIRANNFLELKASLGYNTEGERSFWGAGAFFKAPVLHLFYTLGKPDQDDAKVRQFLGLELSFSI